MSIENPSAGIGVPKDAPEVKKSKLEIKEISRSVEKIDKQSLKVLLSWGDYTLLTDNSDFVLYDEKLDKIFNESLNIETDWSSLGKKYDITHSDGEISITKDLSKIDNKLHKKDFEILISNWVKNNPSSSWMKANYLKNKLILGQKEENVGYFSDGRYLFLTSELGPSFKCFDTQDDRGIIMSPNNWRKYDSNMPIEKVPEDIQEHLIYRIGERESTKEINDKYAGMVTDLSVSILAKNDINGQKLFSESLSSVGDNLLSDPTDKNIIYFCQEMSPTKIMRLDTSGDPATWKSEFAKISSHYKEIKDLKLDPTGTFFLFYSDGNLVMTSKDTFEEVQCLEGLSNVNFDSEGRIRAVDKDGYLVLYDVNYDSLNAELAKNRAQALAKGVDIKNIFSQKNNKVESYDEKTIENLKPIKEDWESEILPKISAIVNMEETSSLRANLNTLKQTLRSQNLNPEQIKFITEGIEKAISDKEKEYAGKEATKYFKEVEDKLAGPISISSINELRIILDKIKPIESLLDIKERENAHKLTEEVNKKAIEIFGREGSRVVEDLKNLMDGTKNQLEKFSNKNEFDDWMEFTLPQLKARLGMLLQDCPIEAFDASLAITNARNSLVQIADNYSRKFELEYAQVREQAVVRTDVVVQTLKDDISALTGRVATKQFKTREEAEQYLATSEAKRVLEEEIQELAKNNPDAAKELERGLKVTIANSLGYIERGGSNVIADTGQQMVMFGDVAFPRFEGKVKEKQKVNVDVTFALDERSKGPGISPNNFYGDVELIITNNKGEKRKVRLYEALGNEDEWRLGLLSYRGDAIPPSYLTVENFKTIKKNLNDWERGGLKERDEQSRKDISDWFSTREKIGKRDRETDEKWQKVYKEKIAEYGKFCSENHILFFRRMEIIKNQNSIDENGKGYVPKWQNHWVNDPTTEGYLEQMAKHFKMQSKLQEGILNLYGHAGTGKDVLIKMFASKEKANMPYFAVDCTKWTTEYELSEDVVLEAKNGATQTVRVPSSVLTGIQTPGGLVYFNELNGMPEQAQIFLHALFDEKRAMTLKTSSGKVVQALPTVLFACSMNPNYPGTFDPQFATKSRMVSIEIDYPPLKRKIKDGEIQGREEPYNSSEALRIARGTESLVDFTYELNMDKNEFVKIWDKNVNGINNDAPNINKTQDFDLNVIKALIQFSGTLRQDFKKNFEKTSEKRDALPVFQPITLREMRRCAYTLSQMPESEKLTGDSDKTARELLKTFFLSNIYKTDDRKKIENALGVMNSKNRVL